MHMKLWAFASIFVLSKSVSATITSVIVKESTSLLDPIIVKLSAFFSNHVLNNYPNIGYWASGLLVFGISLLFFYSDKDDPFIKFVFIDRMVGISLATTAIYIVMQPYVEFL